MNKQFFIRIMNWLFFGIMISMTTMSMAAETIDQIVAKVDDGIVTRSRLDEASRPSLEQIHQNYPPDEWDRRDREVRTQILNQMINEGVCLRFARDNQVAVSDAEIEATISTLRENAGIKSDEEFQKQLAMEGITLDALKENLRKQSIVRRVLRNEVYTKIRVTEPEIMDYYKANNDIYQSNAKFRVGVLMIDTESSGLLGNAAAERKIREIHDRLDAGEDFATLVKLHSDGPASENGGDIGFLEEGKALPIVEKTAFQLDVGHYSDPLQTDFGWVIVKLLEKVDAGMKPLQELRDEIEMAVREKKARNLEQEWFDRQRALTYIEILEY